MYKVLFFAALREQLDCDQLEVSQPDINTIGALHQYLSAQSPQWQQTLSGSVFICS